MERGDADDTCSATIWVGSHERRVSGCGRDGLPAGGSKDSCSRNETQDTRKGFYWSNTLTSGNVKPGQDRSSHDR